MAQRTTLLLDERTRKRRDLARRYDCSTSEPIRRAIVKQLEMESKPSAAERKRRRDVLERLWLADSGDVVQLSAVAWYEFSRGPRTPVQLAVARSFFPAGDGIVPLSEELAIRAAEAPRRCHARTKPLHRRR